MSVAASHTDPPSPFETLPESVRSALRLAGTERTYARGDLLLVQGEPCSRLRILLTGRAKLCRDLAIGRTVVLALYGPGDFCGSIPALSGLPSDASIVALGPMTALEIERDAFLALISGRPALLGALLPLLAGRLTECRNCMVELTGERVEPRLAGLFLRLVEESGVADIRGVRVPIRLTRQELADLAGTSLETAIRVLSRWRATGLVETRGDGFLVADLERLATIARQRST